MAQAVLEEGVGETEKSLTMKLLPYLLDKLQPLLTKQVRLDYKKLKAIEKYCGICGKYHIEITRKTGRKF